MNVSLKWLGTLVDIKGLDPEEMAETLTVDGIPVEHVIYPGKGIQGVVTGKILSIEKHPDADHLVVCQLDCAKGAPIQIVTGASNVEVGQIVPVALDGAHVPAKHDAKAPGGLARGDTKIKAGKLRGVVSNGMMCSLGELGLDDNLFPALNKEGILILPADTPIGVDFHTLFDLDDVIYEMELTANRADCFSMIGMALEVGAIFKRKVNLPEISVKETGEAIEDRAEVHIAEPAFCKRFCGRLLENVTIGRSPEWIENRLRSNGIRPINNVVDAANYVMLEIGQPLHTYDYDKVAGHSLTCRFAKEGETIKTLDGQERALNVADLVIADGSDTAACIAGVMGGFDSEVTEKTKSVLLEAAVFDSASIRRTSRRLGLRSEASGRYEKGINPARSEMAINRICQLLVEQGAASAAPGMLDEYPVKAEPQVIETSVKAINDYIGIHMPKEEMLDILTHLSTQRNGEGLDAPADAKHRNLAVESQSGNHQFGSITFLIDVVKTGRRLFAHPQRIMVAATRQNQSIKMLQGIDDDLSIGNRRNNDWRTASRYYLLIITVAKRSIDTFIIGSKANYRLMLRFGKSRVCILEMRL